MLFLQSTFEREIVNNLEGLRRGLEATRRARLGR